MQLGENPFLSVVSRPVLILWTYKTYRGSAFLLWSLNDSESERGDEELDDH